MRVPLSRPALSLIALVAALPALAQEAPVRAVTLFEISVIQALPAYPGTIVQARSAAPPTGHRLALAARYLDTLRS